MANIGITLRSTRIQRGLTIEQVAQDTRISARFLEALENEEFDELPAPVYVRGFLRSYANYLQLDPQPLLAGLSGAEGGASATPPVTDAAPPPAPKPSSDPFRPSAPARPRVIGQDDPLRPTARPPRTDPFSARRPEPETPLDPTRAGAHRGRVGGVLMERGAVYEDNGRAAQIVAIAGGGFVLLVVMALLAIVFAGGDDGGGDSVLAGDGLTQKPGGVGTVIVAGSATAQPSPSGTAEAAASVTASATGSTTPEPGTTPTATTSTAADGQTPAPSATPTQAPPTPTPTPRPPTPTPTPPPLPIPSAYGFDECTPVGDNQYDCGGSSGDHSSYLVVCYPGGWFVDVNRDYDNPGFPEATVPGPASSGIVNLNKETCS